MSGSFYELIRSNDYTFILVVRNKSLEHGTLLRIFFSDFFIDLFTRMSKEEE